MSPQVVRQRAWVGVLVSLLAWSAAGVAGDAGAPPVTAPVFAVDSVAHAGMATRIASSPDERHLVTTSHDKSIRIWDAETGQLLRRLMVPVEEKADGEVRGLALSPDGTKAAIGGHILGGEGRRAVLVVSLADGTILRRIPDFHSVVWSLAWSPDGRFLAVGLGEDSSDRGLRIYETANWQQVFSESDVDGRISDMAFRADGTLFATTHEIPKTTSLYLYARKGDGYVRSGAKAMGKRGGFRAYWSRDERFIYVQGHGYYDASNLTEPPHPIHAHRNSRTGGPLSLMGVRESPDGRQLVSLTHHRHEQSGKARRWKLPSSGYFEEVDIPDPRPMDFVVLRNGTIAYVTESGVVAALDSDLKPKWRNERSVAAIENRPDQLRVSTDGRWISIPAHADGKPVDMAFNLFDPQFVPASTLKLGWSAPETSRRGMTVLSWQGTFEPSINDVRFPMRNSRERSLSVAVHSRDDAFVFGTTGFRLLKADSKGLELWSRYLQSDVSAVNIIEDRGLVVAATVDGYVHVLRWSDGQILLRYYLEPGARRWVAISDRGFYESGVGSEDMAGWIVRRSGDRVADFFPLSRFRNRYHLPGIAGAILGAGDAGKGLGVLLARRRADLGGGKAIGAEDDARARREAESQAEVVRKAEDARQLAERQAEDSRRRAEQVKLDEAARQAEAKRLAELRQIEDEKQRQLAQAKAELARLQAIAATAVQDGKLGEAGAPSAERLPPVVDVLSPGFDVSTGERKLKVRYRVKTSEGAPVTRVQGRVIARSQATRGLMPKVAGNDVQELELELPGEDAEIQIVAENRWGPSVPATIKVRWQGAAPKARTIKGDLHIIAVGVSDYDQPDYKLGLAAKDAQDFVASLRRQEGGLYGRIQLKVLTDRQADKKSVEDAILALRAQVQPQDTTMVFLAGHGVNDVGGEYVYLPRDAKLEQLGQTGVSFRLIRDTLARLPGRTVMFVDTCHSGNVVGKFRPGQNKDYTAAINEMASSENNIIVFASSTGTQLSLEDPSWGNGAFTKALVEGLSGQADMKKRGRVTYKQLDAYVSDRVDELTQGRQTPVTPVLQGVPDFTLAEVRK